MARTPKKTIGHRAKKPKQGRLGLVIGTAIALGGCGLRVPDMTLSSEPNATPNLWNSVVTHIKAELECAVVSLYEEDQFESKQSHNPPALGWLATGSGKTTITLTADEKSILNPTAIYVQNFPTASQTFANKSIVTTPRNFGLAGGVNLSSDATRVIQADYTFDFQKDFFSDPKIKNPEDRQILCSQYSGPFIDGNLKIADSFHAILLPYQEIPDNKGADIKFLSGGPSAPGGSGSSGTTSTMQTHITFILAGTGSVTPAWKLIPVAYNVNSNPFFQSGRTRTDDVIVTIGKKPDQVATAHDITKIGIQNNIFLSQP